MPHVDRTASIDSRYMAEVRGMALTHMIGASPIADRYARGWHCLGLAADYKDGKPHTVNAFGSRLVAYLGDDD